MDDFCGPNDEQRKNLERLGRYLANLPVKYVREHFEMTDWFMHNYTSVVRVDKAIEIMETHQCGAVACAIGHAPFALPDVDMREMSWTTISDEVFGVHYHTKLGQQLFSSFWADQDEMQEYDGTAYAVADRIAAYLFENAPVLGGHFSVREQVMERAYGAARRAGWVKRQRMTRKVMQHV